MAFSKQPLQLGKPNPSLSSYERPGSYAIIFDEHGRLAIMRSKRGSIFLPGGGIEANETKEEALVREVIEEAGLEVRIQEEFINVNEWFYEPEANRNMNKVAYFFIAEVENPKPEGKIEDYQLHWVPLEEIKDQMKFNIERFVLDELTKSFV
ncbi:MAG: NUDIX domain-containing protein [Saprospiraceae bacterium]|nr:NUDIX domain-containing protein [Saprospiraceae bacterium]